MAADIITRLETLMKQGEDYIWRPATDAATEIRQLRRDLEYAYRAIEFGFQYGSFDFSVLRKRAAVYLATLPVDEAQDRAQSADAPNPAEQSSAALLKAQEESAEGNQEDSALRG
jgi:hypothetical protein